MRILAIETSCDETAIAIVETKEINCDDESAASFKVLGNALLSQIETHKPYGGVFPALAKREHAKNLVPLLEAALEEAELLREDTQELAPAAREAIAATLEREGELAQRFFEFIIECKKPELDAIAVTAGPGLEPALWVGINFAKALALAWGLPLVAANHMEGHIFAALAQGSEDELEIKDAKLPLLALLISGGHTELVLMRNWLEYKLIGQTRDDAVGEAFDKVARMLELPYPGGPEISKLAEAAREASEVGPYALPRPMIHEQSCDFSFAGLKTAVLRILKEAPLNEAGKRALAFEFENAVAEVLWKKTARALEMTGAKTLVIGGGVSANKHIRRVFTQKVGREFPAATLRIPAASLTTDNAVMIALVGYFRALKKDFADIDTLAASGNRALA